MVNKYKKILNQVKIERNANVVDTVFFNTYF